MSILLSCLSCFIPGLRRSHPGGELREPLMDPARSRSVSPTPYTVPDEAPTPLETRVLVQANILNVPQAQQVHHVVGHALPMQGSQPSMATVTGSSTGSAASSPADSLRSLSPGAAVTSVSPVVDHDLERQKESFRSSLETFFSGNLRDISKRSFDEFLSRIAPSLPRLNNTSMRQMVSEFLTNHKKSEVETLLHENRDEGRICARAEERRHAAWNEIRWCEYRADEICGYLEKPPLLHQAHNAMQADPSKAQAYYDLLNEYRSLGGEHFCPRDEKDHQGLYKQVEINSRIDNAQEEIRHAYNRAKYDEFEPRARFWSGLLHYNSL